MTDLPKSSTIVKLRAMRQLSQALGISFFHTTAFLSLGQSHAPHVEWNVVSGVKEKNV